MKEKNMDNELESNIKDQIQSLIKQRYRRTESFHTAILLYSKEIEINYPSLEDRRKLAVRLDYTESMGQEIQKIINIGKIIRECNLNIT